MMKTLCFTVFYNKIVFYIRFSLFNLEQMKKQQQDHVHSVPNTIYYNNVLFNGLEQVFDTKWCTNATIKLRQQHTDYVFGCKHFIAVSQIK